MENIQITIQHLKENKILLKNIGISAAILFVVCLAQIIIHEVATVVDSIPLFNTLMEVIGLTVSAKFVYTHLLSAEKRNNLRNKAEETYKNIIGG